MARTVVRVGLVYLAVSTALVGFWAAFAPRSFYTDFPGGGRHWVAVDGPYNEHLVRDVGELSLALLVVLVAAAITMSLPLVRTALLAAFVNGALHLVYHARHTAPFGTGDAVAVVGSLALAPVLALVLLVLTRTGADAEVRPAVVDA
jgi:fructose-specific phosphotransferase system IIC component